MTGDVVRMVGRQIRRPDGTVIVREFWRADLPVLPITLDLIGDWVCEELDLNNTWRIVATGTGPFRAGEGTWTL